MTPVSEQMAPITIMDLPPETHAIILKCVFLSCQADVPPQEREWDDRFLIPARIPRSLSAEWKGEEDLSSPGLFPYNAVATSKLWSDILRSCPEVWTRVVFDVAKDPKPFLDAFSWSKNRVIHLFVFSSAPSPGEGEGNAWDNGEHDARKSVERARVQTILQAFIPHIERCWSIVFRLIYESSLPDPTILIKRRDLNPRLSSFEELSLDCRISDMARPFDWSNQTGVGLHQSFPHLSKLSLTGRMFMDLINMPYLCNLKFGLHCEMNISQFSFNYERDEDDHSVAEEDESIKEETDSLMEQENLPAEEHDSNPDPEEEDSIADEDDEYFSQYLFSKFITYLAGVQTDRLRLKNLRLTEEDGFQLPPVKGRKFNILIFPRHLVLDRISPEFFQELFGTISIYISQSLSISDCRVPRSNLREIGYITSPTLCLTHLDPEDLENILNLWNGEDLAITSCLGVNDAFLEWLSKPREEHEREFIADTFTSLSIRDCPSFSSTALRLFVDARKAIADAPKPSLGGSPRSLDRVTVEGMVQALKDEDAAWFAQHSVDNSGPEVSWLADGDADHGEDGCA